MSNTRTMMKRTCFSKSEAPGRPDTIAPCHWSRSFVDGLCCSHPDSQLFGSLQPQEGM